MLKREGTTFNFSSSRANQTFWGQWLWTVDLWSVLMVVALLGIGTLLVMTASPGVTQTYGYDAYFFVKRHSLFVLLSFVTFICVSLLTPQSVRRLSLLLFLLSWLGLLCAMLWGVQHKGAQRWLGGPFGLNIQPSELIKPALIVLSAWMFSEAERLGRDFPGYKIALGLLVGTVLPILFQPDIGMSVLIVATWLVQLFVAGLSLLWVFVSGVLGVVIAGGAYLFFPHVQKRLDAFWSPQVSERFGDQFQVTQSLEAFSKGGFWGRGPGEGVLKKTLPDAHTDFVFSVAGEEFGGWFCLVILGLYFILMMRASWRIRHTQDSFIFYSVAGLVALIGLQVLINTATTLALIPPKGMTLPLISYGGSSMLGAAITMGFLLALTRKRVV